MKKQMRETNIELLRIITMIIIVIHHLSQNILMYEKGNAVTQAISIILFGIGQIGVSIFILITGYFQIDKEISMKKIAKLWLQVLFYSSGIALLSIKLGIAEYNKTLVINALLPISYNQYWFVSIYMILYIISPFLNKIAKRLTQEELKKFLITFMAIFSIAYSYLYNSRNYNIGSGAMGSVAWFSFLYLLAGYIKMYKIKILENKRTLCILTAIASIIFSLILIACDNSMKYEVFYYYTKINSIFVFILSVLIFYIFKNMKIKQSRFLNYIASLTFAVYLIHENYIIREYFWKTFRNIIYIPSNALLSIITQIIISIIIVFSIAAITECIRRILEKIIFKSKNVNNMLDKAEKLMLV